jgi:probable F420-dependent oxidoreductase
MTSQWRERLGRFGIWRPAMLTTPELAAHLERLGFGAVWLGGSPDGDLAIVDQLLGATTSLIVGTSIVNIWKDDAATVAASYHRIEAAFPGRFVLGVGAGHREATAEYASPYQALADYVDRLTRYHVPAEGIVLAALGPRVLRLAASRTAGAIPYLVPPEHTRLAREILGPSLLLAPEHKVVLEPDPERARGPGRARVANPYLNLVNYTSNLRRLGFTDDDIAHGGSDRLIDALVAHGTAQQIGAQLSAHLAAGADHVCVQLLASAGADLLAGYAELARALGLTRDGTDH